MLAAAQFFNGADMRAWIDIRLLRLAQALVLFVARRPNRSETTWMLGHGIALDVARMVRFVTPVKQDKRRFRYISGGAN